MTASEILLVIFTAVIALTGVIGAIIFGGQLTTMQGQLNEMKAATTQTSRLLQAAEKSAEAAKNSVDLAKESLISTQRAYVFITGVVAKRGINSQGDTVNWIFQVQWKNSGNTPTENMFTHVNLLPFKGDIPADFDFHDLGGENVRVFVGPQAVVASGTLGVSVADIEAVIAGTKKLFLWGWAEYDDIFAGIARTPRHRVEYCFDVQIAGDARSDKNAVQTSMYRRHNGQSEIQR